MIEKSAGVDFDRQVFVQTPHPVPKQSGSRAGGLILGLLLVAGLAFIGYKLLPQSPESSAAPTDASSADVDRRLTMIEERLTKLEEERKATAIVHRREAASAPDVPAAAALARRSGKTVYRVSTTPWQGAQAAGSVATADSGAAQRMATLQQGIGQLQKDQAANDDAWQATTNRLADMAGQVGTQNVQMLRNQDELNELVNRTEMEAIPFELLRGSNPTPVGPVSLVLKSTNAKKQSYTVCVYVQPTCIELKDRMVHEVVQFVVARNTTPLEVIATRIVKDEILGYLEVPRNQLAH
jgi:hypothetical protein